MHELSMAATDEMAPQSFEFDACVIWINIFC